MPVEDMALGDEWISDDSSFYGDEDEQDRLYSLTKDVNPKNYWLARKSDLNVVVAQAKAQVYRNTMPAFDAQFEEIESISKKRGGASAANFLLDRRAIEKERLAGSGQREREPSSELALFNPGQGSHDAWQLGETVDEFIQRLPPLTTQSCISPWIWVHNPRPDYRNESISHDADEFRSRGRDLLSRSIQTRQQLQGKGLHGSKVALTKSLDQESKALQKRITELAVECGILSGKWMLFPKLEEVTQVWKKVIAGVIDGRLGPTAKVATDEGNPGDRLICVYTKDFRDENDVLRVLQEVEAMGLLTSGRSIYYKSDAYTYLDVYGKTAAEYGLQASLYNSYKMMATGRIVKAESSSRKKQSTLNNFF